MALYLDDTVLDGTKEIIAVSSISNEIKSSVHSYLLAASPRSATLASPATPNNQIRKYPPVLSPWNGCIGASLDSHSPRSVCIPPPTSPSPETNPVIVLPQATYLKFPMHCSLSPTRNRFHSPKASASSDDTSTCIFDLRSVPDLEENVGRTTSTGSLSFHTSPESKVQVDSSTSSPVQGVFDTGSVSVPEQLTLFTGFQFSYSSGKPPRPPRQGRRLPGKGGDFGWRNKSKPTPGSMQEYADKVTISVVSLLLVVLFTVLLIFGGQQK